MFVWSKRLVAGLLGAFVLLIGIFFIQGEPETISGLKVHTTRWMAANYIGLLVWLFIWMFDQARVRGKTCCSGWCPLCWPRCPPSCCSFCFCRESEVVICHRASAQPAGDMMSQTPLSCHLPWASTTQSSTPVPTFAIRSCP